MSNIVKNKSILPKTKENMLSKENFENQLLELLRKYKLVIAKKHLLYLNIITTAEHYAGVVYLIKGNGYFCRKIINNNIDFEKDYIKFLQKFKVIGDGRGIQKIELECKVGETPTIKIESIYYGSK